MSKDNGGPAFTVQAHTVHNVDEFGGTRFVQAQDGMTLRDYFAAKAMAAVLEGAVLPTETDQLAGAKLISGFSYLMADAMLKARAE